MIHDIKQIQSPCINICALNQQNICIGCYRSIEEIACWSQACEASRGKILENVKQRKCEYKT